MGAVLVIGYAEKYGARASSIRRLVAVAGRTVRLVVCSLLRRMERALL